MADSDSRVAAPQADLTGKTNREIENWIVNLRKRGQGEAEFYRALLEECAPGQSRANSQRQGNHG